MKRNIDWITEWIWSLKHSDLPDQTHYGSDEYLKKQLLYGGE